MGLSIVISGIIIMTSIVLVMYIFSGVVANFFSLGEVTTEVLEHQDLISKSEISMHHVSTLVGSPNVNFSLRNDGQVKTWQFSEYDVFVTYNSATSGMLTEQLSYAGDCLGGVPTSGTWCIQTISRDILDPGLLNPTESAKIRLRVNENLSDVNAIVSISTAKGVTLKVVAPYCGPSCYQMNWKPMTDEGNVAWNNLGPGIEEFDNTDNWRTLLDLTDMTEWRLIMNKQGGSTTASCLIGAMYSTDGGATFRGLDNGVTNTLSTNTISCDNPGGSYASGWTDLNVTAQSDVWINVFGTGAGGADDPTFGGIELQFRS